MSSILILIFMQNTVHHKNIMLNKKHSVVEVFKNTVISIYADMHACMHLSV